jgi:hypothetical protein
MKDGEMGGECSTNRKMNNVQVYNILVAKTCTEQLLENTGINGR